ncbi:MAG: DUF5309 family protein [Planctomycetes bacterium]|nr:DUF5309 family protein [Planctomycetota bacterium]
MPYTGKSTFDAGSTLPELAEDISDIISIVSPYETPLLDRLGDPQRVAQSTVHEWIEDTLLPNFDSVNQTTFSPNGQDCTDITVANISRFQVGDLVRPDTSSEVLLVTAINASIITVIRRYGSSPAFTLTNGRRLHIIGNAALEGAPASAARATTRQRRQNYTQIFSATVDVSGSMQAARKIGIADELDYQKSERARELLRDLENCIINGVAASTNPQGTSSVRRTMDGLVKYITTNKFTPGSGGFPSGGGSGTDLNETLVNTALRNIWEQSNGSVDTIVVGGFQKRRINQFIASTARAYSPADARLGEMVSVYESDFGVCRVVVSRWMPADSLLLLDSSRINVLPLTNRSFHYKPLATTGDSVSGQLLGEYTLEFRNELAHGMIRGLSIT